MLYLFLFFLLDLGLGIELILSQTLSKYLLISALWLTLILFLGRISTFSNRAHLKLMLVFEFNIISFSTPLRLHALFLTKRVHMDTWVLGASTFKPSNIPSGVIGRFTYSMLALSRIKANIRVNSRCWQLTSILKNILKCALLLFNLQKLLRPWWWSVNASSIQQQNRSAIASVAFT